MSGKSTIEWTEATWNPVTGCSKVSPGCAHCYAETATARFAGRPGWIEEHRPWTPENAGHNLRLHPERLDLPLRWERPRRIFVNSMSDLFHEQIPDSFIDKIYGVMHGARHHIFQVLTKRPERAFDYYTRWAARIGDPEIQPISNVWLGVSIENARYTWRADVLRKIPAVVRFISAEPLLGSLYEDERTLGRDAVRGGIPRLQKIQDLHAPLDLTGIDWLIVGGESGGRDARPMHLDWVRELRDACLAVNCPRCGSPAVRTSAGRAICGRECPDDSIARPAFFVKQMGSVWARENGAKDRKGGDPDEWPRDLRMREMPDASR